MIAMSRQTESRYLRISRMSRQTDCNRVLRIFDFVAVVVVVQVVVVLRGGHDEEELGGREEGGGGGRQTVASFMRQLS